MKIVITGPDTYESLSADVPEPGMVYQLEDAAEGTGAQGRLFHPLVLEYWKSGLWSYPGSGYRPGLTFHEFREEIKKKLGKGFEAFLYADIVDGKATVKKVAHFDDIPEHIRTDERRRELIYGRLWSWVDYSKKWRRTTIDNLIHEMLEMGVNSKKFDEIMQGIGQ